MASILLTPAAENDLVNIWFYIARDDRDAADQVYQAAERTFDSLLAALHMGTLFQAKRPQLKGMRFFPVNKFQSYVIYYRAPQGIEIVRVSPRPHGQEKCLEPEELPEKNLRQAEIAR